jgi:transposase-like protein
VYPRVVRWLDNHLDQMLVHQHHRRIPKTNNIAENLNKQLQRRFKTIEAFQSRETAWNYQNLIRNYLRFKPYTDYRGERRCHNGMSPLEVCGVTLPHRDWVKLATSWN